MVVEDQSDMRKHLADAIQSDARLRLVDAVESGFSAMQVLVNQDVDVMLVDIGLPDMSGLQLIRQAVDLRPALDCMVVSMFRDDELVLDAIRAGATGYLLKDALQNDIAARVLELSQGGSPISPAIARLLLRNVQVDRAQSSTDALQPATTDVAGCMGRLTARELDVLRQVGKGLSFREIADVLAISQRTIVSHVKNIYRKMAVHSRGEAVYEATWQGLL